MSAKRKPAPAWPVAATPAAAGMNVVLVAALAGIDKRTMVRALLEPGRIRSAETRAGIVKALRALGHHKEADEVEKAGKTKDAS